MRYLLATAVVATAILAQTPTGQARAAEAPWCSYSSVGNFSLAEDCSFVTFEACRDTVLAGNRGFCNHNPRYTGPMEPAKRPAKRQVQAR